MHSPKYRTLALVLSVALLFSFLATADINAEQAGEAIPPERLRVFADYEGAWVKLSNHLLRIFLPEGWELSSSEEGALMAARDLQSGNGLRVEELKLPRVTLEGVLDAFRADKEMTGVSEVYINDLRLVRYESPASDVLGFVSLTGYGDRVLLFKFEKASDEAFTEMAVRVMSTLTRVAKAGARKTAAPTATPIPGVMTWAELLKAAKAGKTLVYIGADLTRGAAQKTAVFRGAVTIKSADGKQYVIDGNGKQAIRVEAVDGGKVSGTTVIEGLKFINGDAGEVIEGVPGSGMGGALYVNGNLSITGSSFTGNKAGLGGAIAVTGSILVSDTVITGNTAIGNGGGIYAQGDISLSGNSRVTKNAALFGGGVFSDAGKVLVGDGEISANKAFIGGGIYVSMGEVNLEGGKVSDNSAFMGGGMYVFKGDVNMYGGEVSGNHAMDGGGIYINEGSASLSAGKVTLNTAEDYGGGIFVSTGDVTVTGGEVSGNVAVNVDGGGVYIADGTASDAKGNVKNNTPNNIAPQTVPLLLMAPLAQARSGAIAISDTPESAGRESAVPKSTPSGKSGVESMIVEATVTKSTTSGNSYMKAAIDKGAGTGSTTTGSAGIKTKSTKSPGKKSPSTESSFPEGLSPVIIAPGDTAP